MSLFIWGKIISISSLSRIGRIFVTASWGVISFEVAVRCSLLFICLTVSAQVLSAARKIDFNIPPQRADLSIASFAEQAQLTLIIPFDLVESKTTNKLVGNFQIEEAVNVLLAGTGLKGTLSKRGQLKIESDNALGGKEQKTAGLFAFLGSLFSGNLIAQDQDDAQGTVLEEIIVTAQKREQSIQDVSVAVTALSADRLVRSGVLTLERIDTLVPGLQWQSAGGDVGFSMRGAVTAQVEANDVSVSFYTDGIDRPRHGQANTGLFPIFCYA